MNADNMNRDGGLSTTKRFIEDILRYAPSKIIPTLIGLLWSFIFTRLFPPSEYGLYGLTMAITVPLISVATEWAAQPLGRFYAEYQDSGLSRTYFLVLKKLFIIIACVLSLLIIIGIILLSIINPSNLVLFIAIGLNILMNSMYTLLLPILPASLDPTTYRRLEVSRNITKLCLAILVIYFVYRNVLILVWADTCATLIFMVPLLWVVYKKTMIQYKIKLFQKADFDYSKDVKRFIIYGLPMMIWFFSGQLLNVGDRFVIQYFDGSNAVGIYTANYMLINGVTGLLAAPITIAAFPIIMKLWTTKNKEQIADVMKKMTVVYGILSIVVLGGTVVVAKPFVNVLLGREYSGGYSLLVPILAGIAVWQGSMLGHKGMELLEKTMVMVRWVLLAAIVNMVLNLIFVPIYGYEAAAWNTFISYFLYTFLIWLTSKRYIPWHIDWKGLFPFIVIAILSVAITKMIPVQLSSLLTFIVQGFIYTLLFGGFTLVFVSLRKKAKLRARVQDY